MVYGKLAFVLVFLSFGVSAIPAGASLSNVFIGQTAKGFNTGADCANAFGATFFNTAGNWGVGARQIGDDTTVHLCGTFSGGTNATLLQFQGSGTTGHPITILFETGAIVQASYCAPDGCIDLNGKSYLVIDGGPSCGKLNGATGVDTACNGLIRNTLAGSSGQMCPDGPCTQTLGADGTVVRSSLIANSIGNPTNIEVKNLHLGPVYVRDPTTTANDGTKSYGFIIANDAIPQNIRAHHIICHAATQCYLISFGLATATVTDYHVYNSSFYDMCWAMGVGGASKDLHINDLSFHDNEVRDWSRWVRYPSGCHPNGVMWYNGQSSLIYTNGGICESGCYAYNNYIHGDMGDGYCCGSASGMMSCQSNCFGGYWFNNLLVSTCTGLNPTRSCGGILYFTGNGGGNQHVYNNTIVSAGGECTTNAGMTGNVIYKNNIFTHSVSHAGCSGLYEVRPNTPGVITSNFNVGFGGFGTSQNNWLIYNTAVGISKVSLTEFRSVYGQDLQTSTSDPKLNASYHLQPGSAAIGLGANLTSLGITALNRDASGNPRPAAGAWDAGAFMFGSITDLQAPTTPTNLAVQ